MEDRGDAMNWTKQLQGRLFSFAGDSLTGVFLEDCTTDDDDMWITDVLIGGELCRAIINWQRLTNPSDNSDHIQMYLPDFIYQRGFDDVKLQA